MQFETSLSTSKTRVVMSQNEEANKPEQTEKKM